MGGSNNLSNPSKNTGFGLLVNRPIRPTQKGLDIIKKHLSNPFFDDFDGRNTLMINRIQNSIDAGAWLRDADAIFYTHEISEYTIMNGVYDLTTYNIAHQAAIAKYQVSDYAIYAREIIELFPKNFNPAYHKFWNINP